LICLDDETKANIGFIALTKYHPIALKIIELFIKDVKRLKHNPQALISGSDQLTEALIYN
jgi:hypothetical protein